MGRARTLAQVYRHFGEVDAAETSRKRQPTVILAALHDLALAGRAPALAAAYAAAGGDAAAGAAIDTLLRMTDSVVAIACAGGRGPTRPDAAPCCSPVPVTC